MRSTWYAFLYVTWKWKTFPCKSQSWRTSNGGTHSTASPRWMFRQFAVCSNMYADGAGEQTRGKERKARDSRRGLSEWNEQVSLCYIVDLTETSKRAARCDCCRCFARFLPKSTSLFQQCLPPAGLDFTRWVHLDHVAVRKMSYRKNTHRRMFRRTPTLFDLRWNSVAH